jgi:HD-GYP domain-containing protein (c-di-GMP phosphodiesterase class II)
VTEPLERPNASESADDGPPLLAGGDALDSGSEAVGRVESGAVADGADAQRCVSPEEQDLVKALNSACSVARLHTIDNSVTQHVLGEFSQRLGEYLERAENTQLEVVQGSGRVSINGTQLELKQHGRNWINDWLDFMERMGVGALIFSGTWGHAACTQLLECFQIVGSQPPPERARMVAESAGARFTAEARLVVLDLESAQAHSGENVAGEEELSDTERAVFLYARAVALAEASQAALRAGGSLDVDVLLVRSTLTKLIAALGSGGCAVRLLALTALPHQRSEPFASHRAHTAILALAMGRLLGLSRGHLLDLGFSAFYDDLGRGLLGVEALNAEGGRDLDRSDTPALLSVACALRGRSYGSTGLMRLAVIEESSRVTQGRVSAAGLSPPHPFSRMVCVAAEFDRRCNGSPWEGPRSPGYVLEDMLASPEIPPTCARLLRDVLGVRPRGTLLRAPEGSVEIVIDGGSRRGHRAVVRQLFGSRTTADARGSVREVGLDEPREILSPEVFHLDWVRALLE